MVHGMNFVLTLNGCCSIVVDLNSFAPVGAHRLEVPVLARVPHGACRLEAPILARDLLLEPVGKFSDGKNIQTWRKVPGPLA